jgi:hypothetical protein
MGLQEPNQDAVDGSAEDCQSRQFSKPPRAVLSLIKSMSIIKKYSEKNYKNP